MTKNEFRLNACDAMASSVAEVAGYVSALGGVDHLELATARSLLTKILSANNRLRQCGLSLFSLARVVA